MSEGAEPHQQSCHDAGQSPQTKDESKQSPNHIVEANIAVAHCLESRPDIHFAIVGGASVVALGSTRQTEDVDIVIAPPHLLREAKNTLRQDKRFIIETRTRHTRFQASNGMTVDIEFLSSPGTFKRPFTIDSPIQKTSSNVPILPVAALLDSKCSSMPNRTTDRKRRNDATDIVFLLLLLKSKGQILTVSEVPSASLDFQHWFEKETDYPVSIFHNVGL